MSEWATSAERARITQALAGLAPPDTVTRTARQRVLDQAAASGRMPLGRWLRPALRFAVPAVGIAGIATVLVLALPRGEDGSRIAAGPQTESCVAKRGFEVRILPTRPAVAVDQAGAVTVVWNDFDRTIRTATNTGRGWQSTRLSGTGVFNTTSPALATNAAGDAIAVWIEGGQLTARYRSAGKAWGDPEQLGAVPGRAPLFDGPAAVVASDGTATVAWPQGEGLRAGRRATDGRWAFTSTETAPTPGGAIPGPSEVDLAVDDQGTVAAVWMAGGASGISAATWPAGAQRWNKDAALIATVRGRVRGFGSPKVAATPAGFVATMFIGIAPSTTVGSTAPDPTGQGRVITQAPRNDDQVVATWLPRGQRTWTTAQRLSARGTTPTGDFPTVSGPDGTAAVAWVSAAAPGTPVYRRPGFPPRSLHVAIAQPGRTTFGQVLKVPGAAGTIASPSLAIDGQARLTTAWTLGANAFSGRNSSVQTTSLTPGSGWTTTRRLSETGPGPLNPSLAVNPTGVLAAAWMRCVSSNDLRLQVIAGTAGAWAQPVRVR